MVNVRRLEFGTISMHPITTHTIFIFPSFLGLLPDDKDEVSFDNIFLSLFEDQNLSFYFDFFIEFEVIFYIITLLLLYLLYTYI